MFWGRREKNLGLRSSKFQLRNVFFLFFSRPILALAPLTLIFMTQNSQRVKEEVWKTLKNEPLSSRDHVEDRVLGS